MKAVIEIHQLLIGSMRNFTYLLVADGEAYVVDPQADLNPWTLLLSKKSAQLKGILLTHTHHDHVGGVKNAVEKFQCPVFLHQSDSFRLKNWPETVRQHFRFLADGQTLSLSNQKISVWHTPGHSAGECSFLIDEAKPYSLLTGDTVFVGMVGRTDLETGNTAELFETLKRISTLPDDTVIYPGHDYGRTPTTTVGREKKESDAFKCKTVEELDAVP